MLNYTLSDDEQKVYLSEGKGVADRNAFMAKKTFPTLWRKRMPISSLF